MFTVHYICSGNTYRSRLAEAYTNFLFKDNQKVQATSSGIKASKNKVGPITWLAQKIIQQEDLIPYMSLMWTETTKEILDRANLLVFFNQEQYDFCHEQLKYDDHDYIVLHIEDTPYHGIYSQFGTAKEADIAIIKAANEKYNEIVHTINTKVIPIIKE